MTRAFCIILFGHFKRIVFGYIIMRHHSQVLNVFIVVIVMRLNCKLNYLNFCYRSLSVCSVHYQLNVIIGPLIRFSLWFNYKNRDNFNEGVILMSAIILLLTNNYLNKFHLFQTIGTFHLFQTVEVTMARPEPKQNRWPLGPKNSRIGKQRGGNKRPG